MPRDDLPDGWLTRAEVIELARLAKNGKVLELGAWKGRSTSVLAQSARYVVSVDRHRGIPSAELGDGLAEYLANVRAFANVAIVIAPFEDFVPLLGGGFDLVFIDGDHSEFAVARDTELALKQATKVVAYHDWDFSDVRRGARPFFRREPDALVGSLASFQVKK